MNIAVIKSPKGFIKGADVLVVEYVEDSDIYRGGINLESVEIIPEFGKEDAKFFIPEFKALGSYYRISILEHLSEPTSDKIKTLLIDYLKKEADEADLDAELDEEAENYR